MVRLQTSAITLIAALQVVTIARLGEVGWSRLYPTWARFSLASSARDYLASFRVGCADACIRTRGCRAMSP
jgi:hypothetical protein